MVLEDVSSLSCGPRLSLAHDGVVGASLLNLWHYLQLVGAVHYELTRLIVVFIGACPSWNDFALWCDCRYFVVVLLNGRQILLGPELKQLVLMTHWTRLRLVPRLVGRLWLVEDTGPAFLLQLIAQLNHFAVIQAVRLCWQSRHQFRMGQRRLKGLLRLNVIVSYLCRFVCKPQVTGFRLDWLYPRPWVHDVGVRLVEVDAFVVISRQVEKVVFELAGSHAGLASLLLVISPVGQLGHVQVVLVNWRLSNERVTYIGHHWHVLLHRSQHRHFELLVVHHVVVHEICRSRRAFLNLVVHLQLVRHVVPWVVFCPMLFCLELVVHNYVVLIHPWVWRQHLVVWFIATSLLILVDHHLSVHLVLEGHHIVSCHLAAREVSLIHLHGVHRHLEHASSAAIWRSTGVWHSTEDAWLLHHVHLHSHALKVHLLHLIILLLAYVINGNLALSPALLTSDRKVVWLIHGVLVSILLEVHVLSLGHWVLYDLVYIYLVPNTWRTLAVL